MRKLQFLVDDTLSKAMTGKIQIFRNCEKQTSLISEKTVGGVWSQNSITYPSCDRFFANKFQERRFVFQICLFVFLVMFI